MKKVCILTSVHSPFDTRIFHKQAKTLAKAGYDVTLIAQHDRNEPVEGINIIALPRPKTRFWRMLGTWRIFSLALKQKSDVYHFHDPELLPAGLLLKWFGRGKVIYDAHEDVPKDILSKKWIHPLLRKPIAFILDIFEKTASQQLDHVITSTDTISRRFAVKKVTTVNNYPILSDIHSEVNKTSREFIVICAGSLSEDYGIIKLIESVNLLSSRHNPKLLLIGKFQDANFEKKLKEDISRYGNIEFIPWLPQKCVFEMLAMANVGAAVYQPVPNALNSQPNKLFEYMMFSLPIVASNFPHWKSIVEANECGLNIDPTKPEQIAQAIEYIISNPELARRMGDNGRRAVLEKYNWDAEGIKLLEIYRKLLKVKQD